MIPTKRIPFHPGVMLKELYLDYLREHGWTYTDIAEHLGMNRVQLSKIINGKSGITAVTALKLAKALGTSAQMWLNAQTTYDLATTKLDEKIKRIKFPKTMTA